MQNEIEIETLYLHHIHVVHFSKSRRETHTKKDTQTQDKQNGLHIRLKQYIYV